MNGPGISLFQGSDSLKLNNSNQKEEDEFLEDEKIRNAELQSLINKAFSDLDDDEDSSISSSHCSLPCGAGYNSTEPSVYSKDNQSSRENCTSSDFSSNRRSQLESNYEDQTETPHHKPFRGNIYEVQQNEKFNSPHKGHCFQANSYVPTVSSKQIEAYKHSELNGMAQLKVMYDVRLREIERLTNDLEAEREEKDHLLRRLNVCEHDKKELELNLTNTKSLLGENRNQIAELQKQIANLKENVKVVEKTRDEFKNELEIAKEQLLHQQQKFIALERSDINIKREKQMDLVIDSLNAKHKTEVNFLQQQLDSAIDRINRKEDDFKNLEKKLEEMEQKHAANLLNKCDSTMRQEATVKALLDEANKEKLDLARKVNSLQQECNMLRNDLEQQELFPHLKRLGNSSEEKDSDSFVLLSSGWKTESKKKTMNMIQTDIVANLKDELHRAILGQQAKRQEIRKLREQVEIKDLQINKMREQESIYLQQAESLKEDMNRVLEQATKARNGMKESEHLALISSLQADIERAEKVNRDKIEKIKDLEEELDKIKVKLKDNELAYRKQNQDYLTFHDKEVGKLKKENDMLLKDKELEWGREMEKLLTESDEVKRLYLEMKSSKDKVVDNLSELKGRYEQAVKDKQELEKQLLRKEDHVKQLQDHILLLAKDNKVAEETLKNDFEKKYSSISEKQKDEIEYLKSKLNSAAATEEELRNLRNEISQSKQRHLELEHLLKSKFEVELAELTKENENLKDNLQKKEAELSLRKICMMQKKDISTATDDLMVIETIYEQNLVEVNRLEKEIDRLKVLEEDKTNEVLKLKTSYERKLDEELQQLENRLNSKHQKELLLAENRVKELSLKYFSEEIEKLQLQHIKDIQTIRDEEAQTISDLKISVSEKEKEVNNLLMKIKDFENLVRKYEEERNQAANMMMQWAREVETLKKDKDDTIQELENLKECNNELLKSFENTKTKLRDTRKAALVYKRRLNEIKTGLSERYRSLLTDIQQKVNDAVAVKQIEIETKLSEIEKEYKNKEKLLKLEYENNRYRVS